MFSSRIPSLRRLRWLVVGVMVLVSCRQEAPPEAPSPPPSKSASADAQAADPSAVWVQGLPEPRKRDASFRRGVALGFFVSDPDPARQKAHYTTFLDEIRDHGATDLLLVVRWRQDDVHASSIQPAASLTVDDAILTWTLDQARQRGLRTFLMPIVHVARRRRGQWRGTLRPDDPEAWWASYGRFIAHYATLAERHRVGMFAVGSELVSMEARQDKWRALIQDTRARYSGPLTYSANWDHFEPVRFWDALDVVGVTAYQELSNAPHPNARQLERGWLPFVQRLRGWAMREGHRYIFTEVGYPSHTQAAARPWDHRPRGAPDADLQARCYRAMYNVWHDDPRLDGLYVWNWFGAANTDDRSYSPRGKPAAHVLRRWFERSSQPLDTSPAATQSPR